MVACADDVVVPGGGGLDIGIIAPIISSFSLFFSLHQKNNIQLQINFWTVFLGSAADRFIATNV